jgi:hypothetical protein
LFKVQGAQLSLLVTYLNERVPDLEDGTLLTDVHILFVCHHFLGVKVGFICVVWTSLGPLPRWVPGPTTRWAPGTTRLALHGT